MSTIGNAVFSVSDDEDDEDDQDYVPNNDVGTRLGEAGFRTWQTDS